MRRITVEFIDSEIYIVPWGKQSMTEKLGKCVISGERVLTTDNYVKTADGYCLTEHLHKAIAQA